MRSNNKFSLYFPLQNPRNYKGFDTFKAGDTDKKQGYLITTVFLTPSPALK